MFLALRELGPSLFGAHLTLNKQPNQTNRKDLSLISGAKTTFFPHTCTFRCSSFIFLQGSYYMAIIMVKRFSFGFNYLCFLIASIKLIISSPAFYVSLLKTDAVYGCTVLLLPLYTFLSLFPVSVNKLVSIKSRCRGLESCN